jgi:hypothetical protein
MADRSDEKEVVNADEYAAMRRELVVMRRALEMFAQLMTTGTTLMTPC